MTNPTKKENAWLLPKVSHQKIAPGLYLVPTPIGNLRDITLRALDVLSTADIVLCEDTRVTGKLLEAYDIRAKLMLYHEHNAARQRPKILEHLKAGKTLAQVSDAGTPLISDPGYKLVEMAIEEGLYVSALPGANAPLPALQLSGFASDAFTFIGFLPTKTGARKKVLQGWADVPSTLIVFESGKRLQKTLADCREVLGKRPIAVVREISKLYEETRRGSAQELLKVYEKHGTPKGEITLVIAPPTLQQVSLESLEDEIKEALKTGTKKDVTHLFTKKTGLPKKQVYDFVLNLTK